MLAKKYLSADILGLVTAFVLLGMMGLVTVRTEENRRASGVWLRHTLQVQGTLSRIYGAVQRAESGERGYLLTKDKRYVENFEAHRRTLDNELLKLEQYVADNSEQLRRVAEIRPLLLERIALLKEKVDLANEGHADEAVALIRDGRGKELMDEIDRLLTAMMTKEEEYYEQRALKMESETDALKQAIAAFGILASAVAIFAIYTSHKQLVALQDSKDSLSLAYNALIEESSRREALQAQLRQSQKLEAIGQLTGGVAHDFNNMLSVIVASLNILRRKLQRGDADYETVIDSALEGADKAAGLIRRLLAFARMQPLTPEPLDANKLVSGMSTILHHTLGNGVKLETVLAVELWMTRIDANELENAILNLAVNARDAMGDGGRLTIETANCYLDDEYEAKNPDAKAGQYVMVSVSDTGSGMTPEIMARAFDPFFTTKPVGRGSGLGLSQVHGFVRQSGGHIKIYSEPGKGTTVKLYLPRYHGEGVARPLTTPPSELPRGRADEIVLIVEDEDDARRLMVQSARELGYTVLEANGGREAIDIIRQRKDIVLMITDVVMPEMDGARLAREATFRRHNLRVLFVSGFSRNAVVHNGVLDPNVHLLTKPYTLEQLARKMRKLLDSPVGHG